ncbi:MAG TPA: hypothetical protein VF483_13370 [Gemmatimonadaceae bacterium]
MRRGIVAGLVVASVLAHATAAAQMMQPSGIRSADSELAGIGRSKWTFGPLAPHVVDAGKRTVSSLAFSAVFMGFGLGIDRLNAAQCNSKTICSIHNPVQAGTGFAFLGALVGGVRPVLHSKCTSTGRALFGILGATVGISAASVIADERMLTAKNGDPATWKTMGSALAGLSLGTGIVTAIC